MSRILKTLYYIRDRVTFWALKTTNETYDDDEAEEEPEGDDAEELEFNDEGTGMRTERILRAIIRIPVRWFQLGYHARKLERSMNKEHPECPVRVKVVDWLVGNPLIENTFDIGLIAFPPASLVAVIISVITFLIFGLVFLFAAFFGYEFEYVDGRKNPRRRRNPTDSYNKLA
ncbi:hypothetical protein TYRP_020006 [Tyrophagus putrescentiae]|nr:hypothetical protein TYRP_020006 [Tyrophagus putrescentiae]